MKEPIQHGGEWWTQAEDGSWLRWNAPDYRWDPQPGPPPFPVGETEPAPGESSSPAAVAPSVAKSGAVAPVSRPPGPTPGNVWDAPPPPAGAISDSERISRRLRDFDPTDGKSRIAQVLIGITSVSSLVTGIWLFQRASSETAIFVESPTLAGIVTFSLFALIAAGIAMIVWFKAAYDNTTPLGATDLRYTPGWAIGCWFIPIGNLFIPKQIADDLWRSGDPRLPADAGAQWKFTPVRNLLHFWWSLWIVQWVLAIAANGMTENAIEEVDIDGFKAAIGVEGTSDLVGAVAGVLLIKIIGDITARQRERSRVLAVQVEGVATPTG